MIPINIPCREAIGQVALSYALENRLRGRRAHFRTSAISPTSMGFEVVREGQRPNDRRLGNCARAAVRKMVYERQCRDKLAVFCKMAFKRRNEIVRAKPGFEILAPVIKNALRGFAEKGVY